jgi:glyoxylase-like metal-dependent hydrolase (beta-lactamase superfamily II)
MAGEITIVKNRIVCAALLAAAMLGWTAPAGAQDIKAYWATSGKFGPGDIKASHPTVPESRMIMSPISMWIIDHPKGLIVFDTGNNVAVSDGKCKDYWPAALCDALKPSQNRDDVIDRQLARLGYSVDQVKYVITSHSHLDHIGNIKMFPNATHVIQKAELVQAWNPEKFLHPGAHIMSDYDGIRDFKFLEVDGDTDLFGDGTLRLISTPGHTNGHQSLVLKLKETGPVIITGDAIPRQVVLEGHIHRFHQDAATYMASVERLKAIRDAEGAPLFMSHEDELFKKMGGRWYR